MHFNLLRRDVLMLIFCVFVNLCLRKSTHLSVLLIFLLFIIEEQYTNELEPA